MENDVEIEKSRKTSRISRGLNPDAPKPPQPPKGIQLLTQNLPKMTKKLKLGRWMTKPKKLKAWTSIKFPWRNYATDLELT